MKGLYFTYKESYNMTTMLLRIVCFWAFALCAHLTASPSVVKLGDFKIDKTYSSHRILLDDGNVYKPVNRHQAEKMEDWQLGDNIMVLKMSGRNNRFILVNAARNEQIRGKVVSFSSS
jgi:hypothetical protein